MNSIANGQPPIIRTERGLTLSGTRITLYDVMDYLKANYPPKFIRDTFNLTESELSAVLSYIKAHKQQVEAEYQDILANVAEIKQYWQDYNRQRLAQLTSKLLLIFLTTWGQDDYLSPNRLGQEAYLSYPYGL